MLPSSSGGGRKCPKPRLHVRQQDSLNVISRRTKLNKIFVFVAFLPFSKIKKDNVYDAKL